MPTGIYKHHIGKDSNNWKGGDIKIKCLFCNGEFLVGRERKFTAKYCNRNCFVNAKPSVKKICLYCKKIFVVYNHRKDIAKFCSCHCRAKFYNNGYKNGHKHSAKTLKKISKTGRGRIPWNYRGISKLTEVLRKSYKCKNWLKSVYKRDNWTCQICRKSKGGTLNGHHIIYFSYILNEIRYSYRDKEITYKRAMRYSFLWNIDNGITLCKKCHTLYHKENGF